MKNKIKLIVMGLFLISSFAIGQVNQTLSGTISNVDNLPISGVKVLIIETQQSVYTNSNGFYEFSDVSNGDYTLKIELPNGDTIQESIKKNDKKLTFNYSHIDSFQLDGVEIFGDRNTKQRGIESITRFPINTNDQIQTVSVISDKLIASQGALTITDAAKNIPGVNLFASYGGVRESMTIRGYRGTPTLKNGVRMDSDFRSGSAVSDMSGVESIQVIKGSAAITQGIGDGLGSAGGVINVVTKTPRYKNAAEISVRSGSWWRSRMQYDAQTVVGDNLGLRITGAYQAGNYFRDEMKNNRVYVNPSIGWRPDSKTEIILEMDYLKENTTPDRGTINLAPDTEEALYDMGSKFLGYKDDNAKIENITYTARVHRELTKNLGVRVAYSNSYLELDQQGATLSRFDDTNYNLRNRGVSRSFRNDRNSTIQIDLMGKDITFGIFDWAWQVGYDYTTSRLDSRTADGIRNVDVINVYEDISNAPVTEFTNYDVSSLELNDGNLSKSYTYGFLTQHHLSITDYAKVIGGLRWSYSIGQSKDVIDPMIGLMISPIENINLFGSYTTTSSLRASERPLADGGTVGISRTKQYEFGIKSQWFNDRLRANLTYFDMNNENLSYLIYDEDGASTELYGLAGDLQRKGVEVEVAGRPIKNVQVMLGYAYVDAQYQNSPAYVDGSRPMNSPYNTANAWVQYKFSKTALKGLSIGAGAYYVGDRPANEYTKRTIIHNTIPGTKYFNMPEYLTLNAQLGYELKRVSFQLFLNNITDEIGYNSYYRGGYINQIEPFNVSGQINFKF